jgi:ABC-type nitrate/sulfonate/bicarbonate transport system substrate-binding protein
MIGPLHPLRRLHDALSWAAMMVGFIVASTSVGHAAEKGPAAAPLIPVSIAMLSFASRGTPIPTVIAARGIAKDHGFALTNVKFADGAAFYAALASGDVDIEMGGVGVFQSMINQGVPIKILATAAGINAQIFSANPELQKYSDLKGRTFAATMAFSEFQNFGIEARSQGFDLLKDVKVMDTQASDVLLQLKLGRADAGLAWDPYSQILKRELPNLHVVADSATLWRQLTGLDGWELVVGVRQAWLDRAGPEGVKQLIAALAEGQAFIENHPSQAGEDFKQITGYPVDLFEKVVREGTFRYKVEPIWEGQHPDEIYAQFRASEKAGFAKGIPEKDRALYSPSK